MADYWYAECLPCNWTEKHTDQNAAIRAAEDHVYAQHRDVPPMIRAEKYMGHVQNRTESAIGNAQSTSPATPPDAGESPSWDHRLTAAPAATVTATDGPPNPGPSGE